MGLELAKAFVTIRADNKVGQDVRRSSGAITGQIRGMAAGVAAAMGPVAIAVAAVGTAATGAFAALQRLMAETIPLADRQIKAEARIAALVRTTGQAAGFTAEQLKAMGAALQEVTTVGDEQILELQAKLLTFRSISGEVFRRATEAALDIAETMGTDAGSAAIQLGKALEDPIRGVTALARAGITFSEQQRAQIKFLVESNRLLDAQKIILEGVEGQLRGTARAIADTPTGKLDQMRNTLGDIKEQIGTELVPLQAKFTNLQIKGWELVNAAMLGWKTSAISSQIEVGKVAIQASMGFESAWTVVLKNVAGLTAGTIAFMKAKFSGLPKSIKALVTGEEAEIANPMEAFSNSFEEASIAAGVSLSVVSRDLSNLRTKINDDLKEFEKLDTSGLPTGMKDDFEETFGDLFDLKDLGADLEKIFPTIPKPDEEKEEPLRGGMVGFKELGRQLQDQLLQPNKPEVKELKEQTQILKEMKDNQVEMLKAPSQGFLA